VGHHFLRWKKQERNKLRLQMTSGQFKGSRVVYLKSFKTLEKASFSEVHQISRNNGYDFQTGNNSGNHTVKTPLISNILFGGLMTNHSYSLSKIQQILHNIVVVIPDLQFLSVIR
jgi:hypothetical protein